MTSTLPQSATSDFMGVDDSKAVHSSIAFNSLDLPKIYDGDPRPTFVIDLSLAISTPARQQSIAHLNPALTKNKDLVSCIYDGLHSTMPFCAWVCSSPHQHETQYRYGGYLWVGFTIGGKWKIVSTSSLFDLVEPELFLPSAPRLSVLIHAVATDEASSEVGVQRLKEEIRALENIRPSESKTISRDSVIGQPRTSPQFSRARLAASSYDFNPPRKRPLDQPSHSLVRHSLTESLHPSKQMPPDPVRQTGEGDPLAALEKFQRLAEAVDVGFFDYDTSGRPFTQTNLDDVELVTQQWKKLLQGTSVTFEMRWKKPLPPDADPNVVSDAQWVLSACVPIVGEDGEIKSISGCTTDINAQKRSAQEAVQRAEALERARASEERFARFAAVAPIAIFRFDKQKNMEYCNERWWELTGITKCRFENVKWPFGVHEADLALCASAWESAVIDRSIGQIEFRLRKEWHDAQGRRGQAWAFCTFFAEFAEDGTFSVLMGSLLDISHIKWAENTQKARAEEALEAKRQQENFIDITSHEMRNPLSAMVQCADTIATSLKDIARWSSSAAQSRVSKTAHPVQDLIDSGLDAVQTILSCAAHQKRIVDDILTLSKLDSNLLLITPVKTDPVEMVRNVLKMFEADAAKVDISLVTEIDHSMSDMHFEWVLLDPSRVSQILINLLGNALKFTRDEAKREVTVRMSATADPPSQTDQHIDYVPAETVMDDIADDVDSNDSEPVYLKFDVQDTGRGLTPEEKAKLFLRFSQASPKTHVQYGGSGLGLFISRKLTELQGGEVGLASEVNLGSIFAFYIRTKRTTAPLVETLPTLSPTVSTDADPSLAFAKLNKKPCLLLVEDNLVNQKVLSKQLERQGCTVYVAGHGAEALEFIKTTALWRRKPSFDGSMPPAKPTSIDVILMDLEMPVMGGLEATSRIRQLQEEEAIVRRIPIISISANARQEQVNEAKVAGVDDSISKPFRIKELMTKLNRLMGY